MTNSYVSRPVPAGIARAGLAALLLVATAVAAQAVPTTGGSLPWDTPIERVVKGLTGPVAFFFAVGALIVCGVRMLFGGEMGSITRGLLTTIVGLCVLVLATRFLTVLFGVSGALVAG